MIRIEQKTDCCGCNACGDICPHDAISFKKDKEGFWYPEVASDLCVECGLCEKVCPVLNADSLKKNDLEESICYAAVHKNLEVVFDSTSGGMFSALAEIMYRSGGYVGGAVYNDDFSVSHYISNDKQDLSRLRSSKYLQSNLEGFFGQVRDLLVNGEKVLVCGTPCQMAALRSFLKTDFENLVIVDFICRGVNSHKAVKKYLDSFEERYGSPVVYIKSKSKEYGWRNLTQKVILKDGRHIYETKHENNFTKGYLSTNAFSRPSCYDCKYKGFPRVSDITLADFWGIENICPSLDRDLGTSLVMVNSKKGESFFEKAKIRISFCPVPFDSILAGNPALTRSLEPPKVNREQFFDDMDRMSFPELAEKYIRDFPVGRKQMVRNFARSLYGFCAALFGPTTSLFKTLRYSSISDILKGNYLLIKKRTVVSIDKGSHRLLKGVFGLGYKRINSSKLETRFLMENNSTLISDGPVSIAYGSDVEIFQNATLHFKGKCSSNINLTIICGNRIEFGKNVTIGRDVTIRDTNGEHYINRAGYKSSRPVIIGDKAWLCEGCTIMPGVKIGEGAIVGAHAFVTHSVPAHSMVSGNPAVVVDEDVLWKF